MPDHTVLLITPPFTQLNTPYPATACLKGYLNTTFVLREEYILTVDRAIAYLQGREQTLAHTICDGSFLPAGNRKPEEEDMEWAFGTMGLQDKAKHLVTLYLEDIADFITGVIDPVS